MILLLLLTFPSQLHLQHDYMQEALQHDHGANTWPLFYYAYSDKSHIVSITKGFSFHRVILFLVSQTAHAARLKVNYITIGWLPILSAEGLHLTKKQWQSLKWVLL